jgi:Spy/CpxP family protein refolding chaperone
MLNSMRKTAFAMAATAALLFATPHGAVADTTTRPAASASATGMRPGPAYVIRHYKTAVAQLDLTDDEKSKVDAVFAQANQKGLDLSQSLADAEPRDRFQILTGFYKQIHQDLAAILTDDQMTTLDQKLGPGLGRRNGGQQNGSQQNSTQPPPAQSPPAQSLTASQPPTSQPTARRGNAAGGGLKYVQQALDKLDLSDDQKQQVKDLLAATQSKLAEIRNNAAAGADVQQELQQVRKDMRQKLQTILTPDQMQAFTDAMRQSFQQRGGPNARRAGQSNGAAAPKETVADNKPADLLSTGPEAGSPVPDTQIIEANGRAFSPSQYKGHVLVLEFGSMSCPVFRSHAQDMERLKGLEGSRAFFMIVYTREAFPAGDKNVERNRDEGVNIPQAVTLDDRKAQALETQRELRITIPIAVDSMDDSVSTAFGSYPNGTVVIGKDGNIATRQQWTNPDTLRLAIDNAVNTPATLVSGSAN